jgi:hypothetical protein
MPAHFIERERPQIALGAGSYLQEVIHFSFAEAVGRDNATICGVANGTSCLPSTLGKLLPNKSESRFNG